MKMEAKSSMGSQSDFPLRIWQLVCYSIIAVSGVFGNSLVISVLVKTKALRQSVFGIYIGSLAIADILVTSLCIPVYVMSTSSFQDHPSGLGGDILCKLWTGYFVLFYFAVVSIFTLVAILYERYLAICHPFKARTRSTKRRAIVTVCLIWVLSFAPNYALFGGLQSTDTGKGSLGAHCTTINLKQHYVVWKAFYVFVFLIQYVAPISCMVYFILRINTTLAEGKLRALTSTTDSGRSALLYTISIRRKSVRTVLIMIISFFACWSLNQVLYFMLNLEKGVPWNGNLTQTSVVLCFLSSSVNPVIYAFRVKDFRLGFITILTCRKTTRVHHFSNSL